jgi:hypothetical protein
MLKMLGMFINSIESNFGVINMGMGMEKLLGRLRRLMRMIK